MPRSIGMTSVRASINQRAFGPIWLSEIHIFVRAAATAGRQVEALLTVHGHYEITPTLFSASYCRRCGLKVGDGDAD